MTGKAIKGLFQDLKGCNNIYEALGNWNNEKVLEIYVDDVREYKGTSYIEFHKHMKKEYLDTFVEQIENLMFCGLNKATFEDEFGWEHKVEVFINETH